MCKKCETHNVCQVEMFQGRICGRELYDETHCIYHSRDVAGKGKEFDECFQKDLMRQSRFSKELDFTGYIFPNKVSFKSIQFTGPVHFDFSIFFGDVDFSHCIFHKAAVFPGVAYMRDVSFEFAEFKEKAAFTFSFFNSTTDYGNAKFENNAFFSHCIFRDETSFQRAQFIDNIWFNNIEAMRILDFSDAALNGKAIFNYSHIGDAKFLKTQFQDAEFSYSRFSGDVHFGISLFYGQPIFDGSVFIKDFTLSHSQIFGVCMFTNSFFLGKASFRGAIFKSTTHFFNTTFWSALDLGYSRFFSDVHFGDVEFNDFDKCDLNDAFFFNVNYLFEEIERGKHKASRYAKEISTPLNCLATLGDGKKGNSPQLYRRITDDVFLVRSLFSPKTNKKGIYKEKISYRLWRLSCSYGRSFTRWALWSLLFAVLFAFIYHNVFFLTDPSAFEPHSIHDTWPGISFLYYSIVTFTTLGFGDIVPKPGWLQFWVILEVILGYIMLGGLISILANKLARRS